MKLAVILGTVRQGRMSERLAKWVVKTANEQYKDTQVELVDLLDYPMPFFDEPVSPRYNPDRKVNEVAQKWLDKLNEADSYIFVTPEYNHSIPGVLKNALDYATWEMVEKPATIVSHGTVGGARATMHLKEILSESRSVVIPSQVAFAGRVGELIDEQGNLDKDVAAQQYGPHGALTNALYELKWYSDALVGPRKQSK